MRGGAVQRAALVEGAHISRHRGGRKVGETSRVWTARAQSFGPVSAPVNRSFFSRVGGGGGRRAMVAGQCRVRRSSKLVGKKHFE